MTRVTGPDCAVMCNLINTHIQKHTQELFGYIDHTLPGDNHYSSFYMGVGTSYTLLQGNTILCDVAPRFKSSIVITVFGLYFGPLVSPLYGGLIMILWVMLFITSFQDSQPLPLARVY